MIFENETLLHSGLNDKNNAIENESLFPPIINSYGVTAFLIKSLEKIKNNAKCEILKGVIDHLYRRISLHIREFHTQNIVDSNDIDAEIRIESPFHFICQNGLL
jgi:preprotein translocase subunit Sec63